MAKKNRHVSDATFSSYVEERDQSEPGFKDRLDALADQRALARKARDLRRERQLTQSELAARAGTGQVPSRGSSL